jgi:alpha-galactosidase
LNLGDPGAYRWVIDTLDKQISEGIDFYRTDFNIDPLAYWRANDAPDRQGITEIRYVTGFLAYFDELLRRHPNLLIDTCASGGRRNDLETLRRGLPITRTDYAFDTPAQQSITHGIAFWIPFYGTGSISTDPWALRSIWGPHPGFGWDVRRKDLDYGFLRRMLAEWRSIGDNYFGDYYPLTSYNSTNSVWMAWQFDRPDLGTGIVQVFRRSESPYEMARFHLRGLEPEGRYDVSNLDIPGATEETGRQLMEDGLSVTLNDPPRATIITYRRVSASR